MIIYWSLSLRFPHQNLVYISLLPTRATCSAHLVVTPIYTWSAAHFTQSAVTPFLLRTNIFLSTLFCHRSLTDTQVSHPLILCSFSKDSPSSISHVHLQFILNCSTVPHMQYAEPHTRFTFTELRSGHSHRCCLSVTSLPCPDHSAACLSLLCHVQTTVLTLLPSSMKLRTCGVCTWT
jgi:hypothetical protein